MKRRQFLSLTGGGIVLAAGATLGSVASRAPTQALEPWTAAGTLYQEPRLRALSYAILSPNPHNRQPWRVDLSTKDTIRLFVDTERLLPETDPFNRQITIGLGCFLETLRQAAAQDGFRTEMDLFPQGSSLHGLDDRPVAEITLTADSETRPDPLFAHVLTRRSVKEPYDLSKPVAQDLLDQLGQSANHGTQFNSSADPEMVQKLRRLTSEALMVETETPRTMQESVDLFRIGKAEIEANPDGIDFSGPLFELLGFTGMMSHESMADPSSSVFKEGIKAVLENAETGMAHIWQVTKGNSRIDQLHTGMDWMRMHLTATALGLSLQPMSQALQEFPEMSALYAQAHETLAHEGETLQMLARLGYAAPVPASPRWPLEAKLIEE